MAQDPREIRREIEQTRERMSETVEAIGYRTDVKARMRDGLTERKDTIVNKASGAVHRVVGAMPDMPSSPDMSMPGFVPDAQQVKDGAKQAVSVAQANPVGLGVGAVAVGFLVGMLFPATRAEDEHLGQLSDELREQARSAGQEALDHGKQVAQDAAQQVTQTVQESGQQHGQELADSLRESAHELRSNG